MSSSELHHQYMQTLISISEYFVVVERHMYHRFTSLPHPDKAVDTLLYIVSM